MSLVLSCSETQTKAVKINIYTSLKICKHSCFKSMECQRGMSHTFLIKIHWSCVFLQVCHLLPQEQEGPRVHLPHHSPSFLHLSTPTCSVLLPTLSSDKKAQDLTRMVHRATCRPLPCPCPCDQVSCRCLLPQGQLSPLRAPILAATPPVTTTQPPSKSDPTSPRSQQLEAAWQGVPALVGPLSLPNLRLSIQRRRSPALCPRH